MKRVIPGIAIFLVVLFGSLISVAMADDTVPAGQKLFSDKKCNTCHSVDSVKIVKKMASSKAPDLSDVGSTRNAEWITKWLNKEVELNAKKHMPTWSGTPEEQKTLVDWVASLKVKK